MEKVVQSIPTVDNFSLSSREKLWTSYNIRDYVVQPSNAFSTSGSVAQQLRYSIPKYGLLNKLNLRIKVTMNDDGGDSSDDFAWTGLQFVENVRIMRGSTELYRIESKNLLAVIQHVSVSDEIIYEDAVPFGRSYANLSNGVQYVYYCPIFLGCFDEVDKLIDTEFMKDLEVVVSLKAVDAVLTNDTDDFTLDACDMLMQYLVLKDYETFYKKRYKSLPYRVSTKDMYNEAVTSFAGTAATAYASDRLRIHCDKAVSHTYVFVAPSGTQGSYMNGVEITTLKVYDGDTVIHETTSNIEGLLLHHTEYRKETHLKDNNSPSSSLVHVINWGVFSTEQLSNFRNLKDSNLYVELTCTPAVTATHGIYMAHEYYKWIDVDKSGDVKVVS